MTRVVHCADALVWLKEQERFDGASFVTSLPDVSELGGMPLEDWKRWFIDAARLVLSRCPDESVAIFFQSDIKKAGLWVDKGYLVARAAEEERVPLLWHKIVCRRPPGTLTFGRAAYSHMLCFSRSLRVDLSKPLPDVLPEAGETNWTRGMGVEACKLACRFIAEQTKTRTIIDPFCGRGMVLAVANWMGLDAVGVELSKKRARMAQSLQYPLEKLSPPA